MELNPVKVFYVRLSKSKRKKDEKTGKSLDEMDYENQIQTLQKKWGNLEVHKERVSGGGERKLLFKLITTLPRGSTIYAVHLDRLSRQGVFNLGWLIEIARKRRITLRTLHDGDLTKVKMTEDEEIIIALRAYTADKERRETSRRMREHIEARIRAGQKWGAGIAKERGTYRNGGIAPNPVFQAALPRLKELLAEGKTYDEITEIASAEFGQKFSKVHIHRMINGRKKWVKKKVEEEVEAEETA